MFGRALSFNQDIGNWDVSNGESFVSIIIYTNVTMYESSTHPILISPFLVNFMYRWVCSMERLHLIKTLVIGMFPMVFGL